MKDLSSINILFTYLYIFLKQFPECSKIINDKVIKCVVLLSCLNLLSLSINLQIQQALPDMQVKYSVRNPFSYLYSGNRFNYIIRLSICCTLTVVYTLFLLLAALQCLDIFLHDGTPQHWCGASSSTSIISGFSFKSRIQINSLRIMPLYSIFLLFNASMVSAHCFRCAWFNISDNYVFSVADSYEQLQALHTSYQPQPYPKNIFNLP